MMNFIYFHSRRQLVCYLLLSLRYHSRFQLAIATVNALGDQLTPISCSFRLISVTYIAIKGFLFSNSFE